MILINIQHHIDNTWQIVFQQEWIILTSQVGEVKWTNVSQEVKWTNVSQLTVNGILSYLSFNC